MKISLEAVKLKDPVLLAGKNFGNTIEVSKISELQLEYDTESRLLWLTYKGKEGIIPEGNVRLMTPGSPHALSCHDIPKEVPAPHHEPRKKVKAQVSGPQHHVFEGPGHGQTGVNLGK